MQPFTASAQVASEKITYFSSFSFPPYRQLTEYEDHAGFEVDVARLIFSGSPYELEFHDFLWQGKGSDAFDVTGADCFGLRVITDYSQKAALMSEPFYSFEFRVYSLAKNYMDIKTLDDLKGLRVAVRSNLQPHILLQEREIPVIALSYGENVANALISGAVDVVFDERRGMEHFFSKLTYMGNISVYEDMTHEYPVGLAFNPNRPDLKAYADMRIAEIKKSGELEALYYRYFGKHTEEYLLRESRKTQYTYIIACMVLAGIFVIAILARYVIVKRRIERNKRISDERYKLLLRESEIILIDFDSNRKTLAYSESAVKLLDIPDNIQGFHSNFRECIHPDDLPSYSYVADKVYLGEANSLIKEIRIRTASKNYEYFLVKVRTLPDTSASPRFCEILVNINEQKLLQAQMENTLYYDKLTSAMNRGRFISECDKMILENKGVGLVLICLDVDHLAKINNLCGFDAGDSVLKRIAAAIFNCMDGWQYVLGRLGNDDFALLAPVRDRFEVEKLFGRIAEEAAKISVGLEIRIPIRIHGGFAFLEENDTILSLLTKADAAQGVAKMRGEALVDYEQGVKLVTLDRDELSGDMIESFENGDFEMWYQPKIDSKKQRLIGMEALMRWNHPTKGQIPPDIFIGIAEQMGFIDILDIWAITQACKQNKIWQDKGYPQLRVSANVSKALFQHVDLVESIEDILQQTGLDSHYLDIELTESLAVSDPAKTVKILTRLREIGVTVSIDDFGSGYASLGTLKTLPFDTLKIDRSLIIDIDKNQTSQQIVKAIMDIAHSAKLEVVAEGVESILQSKYLKELDCNIIQGFYFGKPVPADEFEINFQKYSE